MTRKANVGPIPWADGDHTFALKIAQLVELQEKCKAGPWELIERLAGYGIEGAPMAGVRANVSDIIEPIRLGLIGGGMLPTHALTLVKRYCSEGELEENRRLAYLIVVTALVGSPEEPLKKEEAAEMTAGPPPTENSNSLTSTETAT